MADPLEEIGRVVDAAYDALAFEPGDEPDWERFDASFHPSAVLALRVFPSDAEVSVLGLADYAREQLRNDLQSDGYSETPGERGLEVVGDVAVVRQSFTMNFVDRAVDAVDVFSLARVAGEWRIVAVVSDVLPA